MFTLLPSLYFAATNYIRGWNESIHHENYDKKQFDYDLIKQKLSYYDVKSLRQDNNIKSETNVTSQTYVTSENNDNIDKQQYQQQTNTTVKLRNNKRGSILLERRKTFTGNLTDDDLLYLMNETGFTREQILAWHSDFLQDCPDGKLSKEKFIEIYSQFYTKGQVQKFCEHAFRIFDKDGSGNIDFVEFLIAVGMTSSKDRQRKIELFFSMYDIDNNGLIDETEMKCVVESIYELMGIDYNSTRIDTKVRDIFSRTGLDQKHYLTKDEFIKACENDRYIRKLLGPHTKTN
ncbi:unnamed protein product [Didymodactylos carnosus]|uniref:EF-hand domain-containing protein n=1 Tax=Didymodactylos carnosus TaxID=1234261 RepID=A0A815IX45_9BILA|nr:unnamed protein product [Didymodactylos carnosus]CAF1371437.1 unnamed protein product [Didymodactylos carnosus]CAF3705894.1 unnamed protein product [Didymodactylos carnosus]CAF4258187.1 unnamed protein product [Didymodactylos carnosus]